ncbi:MAG: hypothetical protein IKO36_07500 [Bacteroidaceae bacterium]|nr:hypothetical protein [Bacteroidaceae bacterium]
MYSKISLILLTIIFSLCSCTEHHEEKYDDINTLMETNPRKGLDKVLLMIKQNKDNSQYTKMKLALLKYKGEDKCNIAYTPLVHTNDSIIKSIYDYFMENGSNGEKLEVNYYMGRTYTDLYNYPLAIQYFNKAIEIGETASIRRTDSMMLANAYSQLSGISTKMRDNNNIIQASKALEIRKKLGMDDVGSYADLANAYSFSEQIDSANVVFRQCIMKIACENSVKENSRYIEQSLSFFSYYKDTQMAEFTYNLTKELNPDTISPFSNFAISSYYTFIKQNEDSSLYYAKKAFDKETYASVKYLYAERLSKIYAHKGDYKTAFDYALQYYSIEDSAKKEAKISETISAQHTIHTQELERTRNELLKEQSRTREYIAYGITALMALLSFFSVSLYLHGKKEKKYLAAIEELEAAKSEIEEKHHNFAEIVEADNRLRAESAKDLASIVTRLKAIGYDPKECLTEDMWEDVFLAVDKLHPNLRSHILSYYKGIDNKDLILIYLTVLGMNQSDAARLFKNARSVTNRKFLRLNTRLGLPLNDVLKEYEDKYEESIIHKS